MIEVVEPDDGALFSPDRKYRYHLWRKIRWMDERPEKSVCFVLLNPSTADEVEPDPTVTRCKGFAGRFGATRVDIVNLFGLVSRFPAFLHSNPDPTGPGNDEMVLKVARAASVVVAGWGSVGDAFPERVSAIRRLLDPVVQLQCLGRTQTGQPKHPLYLKGTTPLERW